MSIKYIDHRPPSDKPPGGLTPSQVPQFIVLGFDDNTKAVGMNWILDFLDSKTNPAGTGNKATYDGTHLRSTFFHITRYLTPQNRPLLDACRKAVTTGHETAIHTDTHPHTLNAAVDFIENEITTCINKLTAAYPSTGIGCAPDTLCGYRGPFLEYNNKVLTIIKNKGIWYDCTIEEGWQADQDGTNYLWPYTLDNGSPGNAVFRDWGYRELLLSYPGLWLLPAYAVIVPPDLRQKLLGRGPDFTLENGKITGFDWNLWFKYKMDAPEVIATLKYTLDLRLVGNKAPFIFGVHSNYYVIPSRQQALDGFVKYALTKKDVRFVSFKQLLDWLQTPAALD